MNIRRQLSGIGWSLVVLLVLSTACQVLALIGVLIVEMIRSGDLGAMIAAMQTGGLDEILDPNLTMMISYGAMYPIALPVYYLMMRRLPAWQKTRKESLPFGRLVLWMIFCFGMSHIGTYISAIVMYLLGQSANMDPVQDMVTSLDIRVVFLLTVVVAPVMEELIFRKILLDRTVMFGQGRAILFSGLLFGLFHGNFYQFFYAAALGMVFAYLYTKTGKISYCIVFHMIFNFAGSIVPMFLMQMEAGMAADILSVIWALVYYGSTVAAVVLGVVFVRRQPMFGQLTETDRPGFWKHVVSVPGMLVFFGLQAMTFLADFAV